MFKVINRFTRFVKELFTNDNSELIKIDYNKLLNSSITKTEEVKKKNEISKFHSEIMKVWGISHKDAKRYGRTKYILYTTKSKRILKKAYSRLGEIQNGR